MIDIYKRKYNNLLKYKYTWILDYYTNQKYININSYYKVLTNYNIFLKNNLHCINYIFNNTKYILKYIKIESLNKIFKYKTVSLKLIGLGYKIIHITNQILLLFIGYSYNLYIYFPTDISYIINQDGSLLKLISQNSILLNNISHRLKQLKKPNPYKENGFKFSYEIFSPKSYKK